MNVYFVNPTYVKSEGWKPLLDFLKVKAAYSFIPKEELPASLYSIIKPYLKASYSNQDMKKFSDNCAFWLRAHFEKHIKLISDVFGVIDDDDIHNIPVIERLKYGTNSPFNNLIHTDSPNCLILLKQKSYYAEDGLIRAPQYSVDDICIFDLAAYIAQYCLNILHKKYGHNQYQAQSVFISFNEFFSKSYRYNPIEREWEKYTVRIKQPSLDFIKFVYLGIKRLAPDYFPEIEIKGKRCFTPLRTGEGMRDLKILIEEANKQREKYLEEEEQNENNCGQSWEEEVKEMNRDFWRECGEGGSNCESWPGWD